MTSMMDKIRSELDQLGDRVQGALEQGKLHIERSTVSGHRNEAARELGMLAWRKASGEEVDEERYATLVNRMDDYQQQLTRIDRELAASRAEDVSVGEDPPPAAQTAEAEVQEAPPSETEPPAAASAAT